MNGTATLPRSHVPPFSRLAEQRARLFAVPTTPAEMATQAMLTHVPAQGVLVRDSAVLERTGLSPLRAWLCPQTERTVGHQPRPGLLSVAAPNGRDRRTGAEPWSSPTPSRPAHARCSAPRQPAPTVSRCPPSACPPPPGARW